MPDHILRRWLSSHRERALYESLLELSASPTTGHPASGLRARRQDLCYDLLRDAPFCRGRQLAESEALDGDLEALGEAALRLTKEWMAHPEAYGRWHPGAHLSALRHATPAIDEPRSRRLMNLVLQGSVSSALLLEHAPGAAPGMFEWIVQVVDRAGWRPALRCEAVLWSFRYYSGVEPATARRLIVRTAAASRLTPMHVLLEIAERHSDRWTREALASNPRARRSPAIRRLLGKSRSRVVRDALKGRRRS